MPKLIKKKGVKTKLAKKYYFDLSKIPFLKLIPVFIFLNLLTASIVFIAKSKIPPQVPLYYGYARGDRQLIEAPGLIIPSLISIGIIITNTMFSLFIGSDFLKRVLIISSFLATALSAITTVKIILLVGSI